MTERPILFSAPMVRAILAGRKSQTRRVVKPQPRHRADVVDPSGITRNGWWWTRPNGTGVHSQATEADCMAKVADGVLSWCPYGTRGNRLWVRETWAPRSGGLALSKIQRPFYRATDGDGDQLNPWPWRPSIHMPRWACRIVLEVTAVRVQRLHDITEDDALAEGIHRSEDGYWYADDAVRSSCCARSCFAELWSAINGRDSWSANPWVWAISFRRVEA